MRSLMWSTIFAMLLSTTVHAQDMCAEAAGQSDRAIREQFQNTIDFFLKLAAAAQSKGFNPRDFPQAQPDGQIVSTDLIDVAERLTAKRDEGIAAVYSAFQNCERGLAPYQDALNIGGYFLGPGIREVVPERALHIDAGRLLAGTPFGGPNALLPQTREYLFARLGIGGSTADFIRNPLQVGPSGLFRAPWVSAFIPGIPGVGLPNIQMPNIPPLGSLPQLPPLPSIPSPPPVQIGTVAGHRVCLPWC